MMGGGTWIPSDDLLSTDKFQANRPPSSKPWFLTIMHVQTLGQRNEDQLGDYGIIAGTVAGGLFLSSTR